MSDPQPHIATAAAWAWFREHESSFNGDRQERILLALAKLDAELWKLDHHPKSMVRCVTCNRLFAAKL